MYVEVKVNQTWLMIGVQALQPLLFIHVWQTLF